eukprot:GFUD01059780.1.p1 GENE.GFUD01059780.1~~GFUD01059780.1.p1  ORF type:complete len:104 (+),score=31.16 GFUD01059780.1:89-400(+)
MDEMGGEEDTGGTDIDMAGPDIVTTVSATLQKMSSWEQSVLAAQQLGIIVGVCLLVGGGFMLMVWVELSCIWAVEKCSNAFGKQTVKDPEDPASLVGSFKRYK